MCGLDLADMQLISKSNKGIRFFEIIISGIQLYNKKYYQKLNHFSETEKDD